MNELKSGSCQPSDELAVAPAIAVLVVCATLGALIVIAVELW